MDHNVSDSSDWLATSLPLFSSLENALRCQICKDFFNTPMITSCSHTFCSICIRRCLSSDGKCPACRSSDQASKLRRNWTVEETVAIFQSARSQALDFASEHKKRKELAEQEADRPQKRRRVEVQSGSTNGSQRQTRSRTKTTQDHASGGESILIESGPEDDRYTPEHSSQPETPVDDGLAECPMCHDRMPAVDVFPHTDHCDGIPASRKQPSRPMASAPARSSSVVAPAARLPELNYSMLTETALRKKLKEMGLPNTTGPKQLLIRRHTEWVNLWNANCDSARPRKKRELLHELDSWERAQGGGARETHATKIKDIDAKAYADSHKSDFDRLVALARAKAEAGKQAGQETGADTARETRTNGTAATKPSEGGDVDAAHEGGHAIAPRQGGSGAHAPTVLDPMPGIEVGGQPHADTPATVDSDHPAIAPAPTAGPGLGAHFNDSAMKRLPMFEVPSQPVTDIDHEQK